LTVCAGGGELEELDGLAVPVADGEVVTGAVGAVGCSSWAAVSGVSEVLLEVVPSTLSLSW
jgi:hypothetical protein